MKYYKAYKKRAKKAKKILADYSIDQQKKFLKGYYRKFPLDLIYGKQLWIISQEAELIRLDPSKRPAQLEILELVQEYIEKDQPLFLAIPKSRRQGVSTLIEAIIFCLCSQTNNKHAIVIADEVANSSNIFEMTKRFYQLLLSSVKPEEEKNNAKELKFKDTKSLMRIDTANKTDIGQSWAFQYMHLSEVALFRNAKQIMIALGQTISRKHFSLLVMESTGRGIGGYFYNIIQSALKGENDYKVHFLPFYKHPEHRMKVHGKIEWHKDHAIYGQEKNIIKYLEKHGADHIEERMYWRRDCIRNKCENKLKIFKQEYPMTISECFQAAGVNVFDIDQVEAIRDQTITAPLRGTADDHGNFKNNEDGWLKVWELPERGWKNRYNIGIDTGGQWFKSPTECADYNVVTVYDQLTKQDVAMIRGHFSPKRLVQMAINTAKMYNNAQITPEINKWASETDDSGLTVIDHLRDKWTRVYVRKVYDKTIKKNVSKVGWHTNKKTRPLLIDYMLELVKEYDEIDEKINDETVCDEMLGFVVNEQNGKYEHQEGGFDDCIFSQAIARYTAREMGEPKYDDGSEDMNYDEMLVDDLTTAFD